ncbi:MAG: hypothetical protein JWP10_1296 [Nocardioidaceae bacterium]|nr:hypothetical protein [Nocardioidaceae bacterium]
MTTPVAIASAVVFGTALVSGVLIVRSGRARVVGVLLGSAGFVGLVAAMLSLAGIADDVTIRMIVLAGCGLWPAAACLYPVGEHRGSVVFVALVIIIGGTAISLARPRESGVIESMMLVLAAVLVVYLWWRLETSGERDRQSLLWLVLATGTATMMVIPLAFLVPTDTGGVLTILSGLAIAPAMAIGVRNPDLVDVRALIVRVVVVSVAMVGFFAVFIGVASIIEQFKGDPADTAVLAVVGAVCAIFFQPLRVILQGVIDQILFGERPDPVHAASQVGDHIAGDPAVALRAVRQALVLPFAQITRSDKVLAVTGQRVTHTRTFVLRVGDEVVGNLELGLRAGELSLSAADNSVLRIVMPALAQVIHAQALAQNLQESREHVVTAVEEERRRLRRDLHDGLGPTLSGVAYRTDAAHNLLDTDPEQAAKWLIETRADVTSAIAEVRRLVEGLRPPALDELGLVAAIRQRAGSMHSSAGGLLQVAVEVPVDDTGLPAAVEVAAYRIAVEALTNVARHSDTRQASVRLTVDDHGLVVEIRDKTRHAAPWAPGVGLTSMQERAALVGGTVEWSATEAGGSVVARLPISVPLG